jgi:hypothetical protein
MDIFGSRGASGRSMHFTQSCPIRQAEAWLALAFPSSYSCSFGTLSTMKSCTGSRRVFEQPRAAVPHCFQWDEKFYTQKLETRNFSEQYF